MNVSPDSPDISGLAVLAASYWPQDLGAGSEDTWRAWAPHLEPWSYDEAWAALEALVAVRAKLPSLSDLLLTLRDHRHTAEAEAAKGAHRAEAAALDEDGSNVLQLVHMPGDWSGRVRAQRLQEFDAAAADWKSHAEAEYLQAVRRSEVPADKMRAALDDIRGDGPCAVRARRLVAGGVKPREAMGELLAAFDAAADAHAPRSVAARTAVRDK